MRGTRDKAITGTIKMCQGNKEGQMVAMTVRLTWFGGYWRKPGWADGGRAAGYWPDSK